MNQELTEPTPQPTQPEHPIRNFSVLLSPTPRGARLARLLATEQLRAWGIPLDSAALIVAELANNAAVHGRVPGRNFQLLLYVVGDTLRIEVTDTRGDQIPPNPHPTAPDSESGRGLILVDALADRWGVAPGLPPRKTIWAELTLPAHESPKPDGPNSGLTCAPYEPPTGEKEPHPSLPPGKLTRASEYAQLGWIWDRLPALRSAPAAQQHHDNRRHATAPAGTAIPVRGPDHRGSRGLPDGHRKP